MGSWKWFWFWVSFWVGVLAILATGVQSRLARTAADAGPTSETQRSAPGTAQVAPPSQPASTPAPSAMATSSVSEPYELVTDSYIPVPWYGAPPSNPDGGEFLSTQIGDVTGDGREDVIAVGIKITPGSQGDLLVYAQKPDGKLDPIARKFPVGGDSAIHSLLGDFNEDGALDVVVTGMKTFVLFASDAVQGFESSVQPIYDMVEIQTLTPPTPMDVDLDGHLDVVFFLSRTHAGSSGFPNAETHSRMVVWFGDGRGGFPSRYSAKTYGSDNYDVERALSVATGDLNQDGIPDLAVRVVQFDYLAQVQRNRVRIYLNDRQGRLMPAMNLDATMRTGEDLQTLDLLAIGDFNLDGRNDLAALSKALDPLLWILHQSPAGSFEPSLSTRYSPPIPSALVAADLDNRPGLDLLAGHDGWPQVTHYLQSAGQMADFKTLWYMYNVAPRVSATGVATGDINGDGCADAAVAASYYGLRLLRGINCGVRPREMVVCRTDEPAPLTGGVSTMDVSPVPGGATQFDPELLPQAPGERNRKYSDSAPRDTRLH